MEQEVIRQRLAEMLAELTELLDDLDNPAEGPDGERLIAWGAKVSPEFKAGVLWIEDELQLNADNLMACMAFETGGTFSPKIKNAAGSSGLGLIQFMSFTHKAMVQRYPNLAKIAPTHADLAKLSAHQQLSFVYYYFRQFGADFSDYTLEDTYMTILFPKAVGKPNDWPMPWEYGELAYKQNKGLDANRDRVITKAEAAAGVRRMLDLGNQQKG